MKRIPVRCKDCGMRRTLPRFPSKYLVKPRCLSVICKRLKLGSRFGWRRGGELRVDRYRLTKERKGSAGTCNCLGYPFTHRKGSKHCQHSRQYHRVGNFQGQMYEGDHV